MQNVFSVYEAQLKELEAQHDRIARQLDILLDSRYAVHAADMLKFVEESIVAHFALEEKMQSAVSYPGTEGHKRLHSEFLTEFGRLRKEYAGNCNLAILQKLNRLILGWLVEHVAVHDDDFAEFMELNVLRRMSFLAVQ